VDKIPSLDSEAGAEHWALTIKQGTRAHGLSPLLADARAHRFRSHCQRAGRYGQMQADHSKWSNATCRKTDHSIHS